MYSIYTACVSTASLVAFTCGAMAFRLTPVIVEEAYILTGGMQSGSHHPLVVPKEETILINGERYWELKPSGKSAHAISTIFGRRETQVVLDDLKCMRRAQTLKLTRQSGAGLFADTTQLRAWSHNDRVEAKRCRDMLSLEDPSQRLVTVRLPKVEASPAIEMIMVAELSLRANLVVQMTAVNLTWIASASMHIRKSEHTNTVTWDETKHAWLGARLTEEHTCMHSCT